jgi:alginate O-acetyltransferase complex protein AlgI
MTFTSFWFLFFFVGLLLLRRLVRGSGEIWLLLLASIAFYFTWSVPCILMVFFTALMDFYIGQRLGQTSDTRQRKSLLLTSLVGNLGLLAFFKYANFILENGRAVLNAMGAHLGPIHLNIIVPPGISYFTFGSISYVLDVYYERMAPCARLRDYSLFVSYFPKILSGPIVRASEFLPELHPRLRANLQEIESGLAQFLIGAVKKMVLADLMAGNVNQIFSTPGRFDRFTLVQGLLGYTAQLYCDFSGYSDMAIGCARILGFHFPENFQFPFSSLSISEFWRRWHITLSVWFRDYLFLPLEMATRDNPCQLLRISINVTITFLLCGLWHGPSWNYVIWGGIHGIALATHRIWLSYKPSWNCMKTGLGRLLGEIAARTLTIGVIVLAMVFFRTATLGDAFTFYGRLLGANSHGDRLSSIFIYPVVVVVILTHFLIQKDRHVALELPQKNPWVRVSVYGTLLAVLACLAASEAAPFIYFKY